MASRFRTAAPLWLMALLVTVALAAQQAATNSVLMSPSKLTETAPDTYTVKLETSRGDIEIGVERAWAPLAADRFYNLVKNGFYDECRFFRIVPNFVVQFGMPADPALSKVWDKATMKDEPVKRGNLRGRVVFATSGRNRRTTQIFINLDDNHNLDYQGFATFGQVTGGWSNVFRLNPQYGERPDQRKIRTQGNAYLSENFPKLDYIIKATIVE